VKQLDTEYISARLHLAGQEALCIDVQLHAVDTSRPRRSMPTYASLSSASGIALT
jgi:hypothetical protein